MGCVGQHSYDTHQTHCWQTAERCTSQPIQTRSVHQRVIRDGFCDPNILEDYQRLIPYLDHSWDLDEGINNCCLNKWIPASPFRFRSANFHSIEQCNIQIYSFTQLIQFFYGQIKHCWHKGKHVVLPVLQNFKLRSPQLAYPFAQVEIRVIWDRNQLYSFAIAELNTCRVGPLSMFAVGKNSL